MKIKAINTKAEEFAGFMESKKRDNGTDYVCFKDDAPKEMINNFLDNCKVQNFDYKTYWGILQAISNYDADLDFEDVRDEIIDGLVDVYTGDLTAWLNESDYNVYYLTEAIEEYAPKDGFELLKMAQYKAIENIMRAVEKMLDIE